MYQNVIDINKDGWQYITSSFYFFVALVHVSSMVLFLKSSLLSTGFPPSEPWREAAHEVCFSLIKQLAQLCTTRPVVPSALCKQFE